MADDLAGAAARLDVDALRAKYAQERDKRLRRDGNAQYVEMAGAFAHYLDDPYIDGPIDRAPLRETAEVLIIGGGFGGLLAGARLRRAGIDDFRIVEKAGDFGGTWYWNRYPGAACDTESYIYLPLLEETGYIPERKYARAPEILEHSRRIGRHFGLYERALLQTVVTDMRWLENEQLWRLATDRGDDLRARFVILAAGPLHRPKLPGVPGVETFKGHSFHTSRWDYAYTGGSSAGGLTGLADKRVGVIGTGATAVQCVPHLGEWAKELYVFQRTPSTIDVRADRPTDPDWASSLHPGWQRERIDNFTTVISGGEFDVDLVKDGWTDLIGGILLAARRAAAAGEAVSDPEALIELADHQKMERVRARVDEIVRDPATAAALKPWYNAFCKRPCFHDQYLQTFNRPSVTLVDTGGRGVERITEDAVWANGREYKVDCLVYATGFEVGTEITRRNGFEVTGRDGLTLTEKWARGAETFHGYFIRGFPNCFLLGGPQAGQSANLQHMLDVATEHLAFVLGKAKAEGVRTIEPTAEAEADWVGQVVKAARGRASFLESCTPGYYNLEGTATANIQTLTNSQFWRGPNAFIRILGRWRADGGWPGMEITAASPS
jgi:cyclohexanone monooxygenase